MIEINRLGEELHREAQAFWCELGRIALDKILTSPIIRRVWANPFYVPGWRAFWERILQEGLP